MEQRENLVRPVIEQDIYKALTNMNDLESPGLDGFGAIFLKATWDIVKDNVITAVMEFL